jgi:hypothetical protein
MRSGHNKRSKFAPLVAGVLAWVYVLGSVTNAAGVSSKVTVTYSISFDGMHIGSFTMHANINNSQYSINGIAKISLLAGLIFEWKGITSSSGRVVNKGPAPTNYSFGYRTSDKSEKVDVKFADNAVREIAVNPPQKPSSARVPVTRQHMQNVVDPLSALLLFSNFGRNQSGEQVCSHTLPIFDGKQRYDLQLSYKRTKTLTADGDEEEGRGYRGPAYVCKIKFVPISGHKTGDEENDYAAQNDGMEVWMIPVARSGLYIPYYIRIPTPVGVATLSSVGFRVTGLGVNHAVMEDSE